MIVLVEGRKVELAGRLEAVAGEPVYGGDALILAAYHPVSVYVHTLICKAGLAAVLSLQRSKELNFDSPVGAGCNRRHCSRK